MTPSHLSAALCSSELGRILDGFRHAVTLTNASDEFVYANPAFTKMYGWTLDEIVGLKPRLLVPEIMSERELGEVRRGISDGSYLGKVVNRNKSGEIFAVELATFQITTPPATQPGLMLGVSTLHGHIAGVVNELVSELCWRLNRSEKDSPLTDRGMSKSRRIQELRKHGYTMKQIAQVMGVDANTPYVILSREKPVRRVVVTANKKSP